MKTTCSYCSMTFDALDPVCPYCGAPNENAEKALSRNGELVPRTIEELKAFCTGHNMPLEQMRFFIGRDYRGPRAFGIYRDSNGNYVVYKNKSDGTRAVRYKGLDEAHAVNELYLKLKEEVAKRKAGYAPVRSYSPPASSAPSRSYSSSRSSSSYRGSSRGRRRIGCFGIAVIVIVVVLGLGALFSALDPSPSRGYYHYNDNYYYYQDGSWYTYDRAASAWYYATIDDTLREDYKDYYSSYSWDDEYDVENFYDSGYYELPGSSSGSSSGSYSYDSSYDDDWDSDWDSDSDWDYDYDSWDSYDTDWDSDW